MSFPFSGKITRASNGTIEIEPDNQFDLQKLEIGSAVSVEDASEPEADGEPKRKRKAK